MAGITLTTGIWQISAYAEISGTGPTKYSVGVSVTSSRTNSGSIISNITGIPSYSTYYVNVSGEIVRNSSNTITYQVSSSQTFYVCVSINTPLSSTFTVASWISAVRLA